VLSNLELHAVESSALGVDLLKSSLNVDVRLTADTTEEKLSLAEVSVVVAALVKEGLGEFVDALVVLLIETSARRIDIASLLVAALHLAVSITVLADAVLVAVAGSVAGGARRSAQVRSISLGSRDDSSAHLVDSLLDSDLLVELLEVLLSGLLHEDTLGGLKRNFKDGDSVGDLDGCILADRDTLVVVGDVEISHLLITILAGLTVALDVLLDVVKLVLEGVARLGVDLSVVDPEEGVDISDVGTDGIIIVVSKAAGANRRGSGDVDVGRKSKLVEDRAGEASLDVEDKLLEETVGGHGVESGLHLGGSHVAATREAKSTLRAVIVEEDKDVVLGARLESLAAADASHILTSEDLDKVVAGHIAASVIVGDARVHIRTVRLVDDLTLLGILVVVSDIILHHDDDVLIGNTHLVDNLISMADISLVTIVVVTIRTSGENNPGVLLTLLLAQVRKRVGESSNSKGKNSDKISTHLCFK